jgi:phosphatidylserine decarboxylase
MMTPRGLAARLAGHEGLNFALTNRILAGSPRGSWDGSGAIEHPWVVRASLGVWRFFADLDLADARTTEFRSLRDCFTRELRPGARPVDPDPAVATSPCDGIVGALRRDRRH